MVLILGLPALAVVMLTAITFARIQRQSWRDEVRPADAIVVFGAAEYAGRPSPVWRARLDHAYDLYQRGVAPIVITTGGHGGDPTFTEGGVGLSYLLDRGVPEQQLIAETQSDDTGQAVERVAVIMKANGMKSCVAVSDGYHIFRIKRMLERHGFTVYGAPRPELRPATRRQRFPLIVREVFSYAWWKLSPLAE